MRLAIRPFRHSSRPSPYREALPRIPRPQRGTNKVAQRRLMDGSVVSNIEFRGGENLSRANLYREPVVGPASRSKAAVPKMLSSQPSTSRDQLDDEPEFAKVVGEPERRSEASAARERRRASVDC